MVSELNIDFRGHDNDFIKFMKQKHRMGGMRNYDYSQSRFPTGDDKKGRKVTVGCPSHGAVQIDVTRILGDGRGCGECAREGKQRDYKTSEIPQFLELTHPPANDHEMMVERIKRIYPDYRWEFVPDSYVSSRKSPDGRAYISIACQDHGERQVRYDEIKCFGRGCSQCDTGWSVRMRIKTRQLDKKLDLSDLDLLRDIDDDDLSLHEPVDLSRSVTIRCNETFKKGEDKGKPHGEYQVTLEKLCYGDPNAALCPCCQGSKLEKATAKWLRENLKDTGLDFVREWSVDTLRLGGENSRPARYDFYIPDLGLLIELDGGQHYRPATFGGRSMRDAIIQHHDTVRRDLAKNAYAREQGLTLIRIGHDENLEVLLETHVLPHLGARTNSERTELIARDNEEDLRRRLRRSEEMMVELDGSE